MRANKLIQLPAATCPNCYLNHGGEKAFPDPRGPVQVFVSKVRHRIPSDRNRKKKKGQTKIHSERNCCESDICFLCQKGELARHVFCMDTWDLKIESILFLLFKVYHDPLKISELIAKETQESQRVSCKDFFGGSLCRIKGWRNKMKQTDIENGFGSDI